MPQAMKSTGFRLSEDRHFELKERSLYLRTSLQEFIDEAVRAFMMVPNDGLVELHAYAEFLSKFPKNDALRKDIEAMIRGGIDETP